MKDVLILKEGKHFTPVGLRDWVNKNFTHLLSKGIHEKKIRFNTGDIHQYILKGRLPDYMGNYKITPKYNAAVGLKYLELTKEEKG